MNDHDESHRASASLCDELFQGLGQRIDDLQREKRRRWCCFFKPGSKRFAYISHRKKSVRLEVWFLGEVESPDQYPSLDIRWRSPTSGGFGQAFQARFYLDNLSQMQHAIDLLYRVSYFASDTQVPYLTREMTTHSVAEESFMSPSDTSEVEETFIEGEKRAVVTTVRNPQLRTAAKRRWGLKCYCCGFDFEQFYGSIAKDFAIVHHREPFLDATGEPRESSVEDVRVVCANCHYVLHLETPTMDVDTLKDRVLRCWSRWSEFGVNKKSEEC